MVLPTPPFWLATAIIRDIVLKRSWVFETIVVVGYNRGAPPWRKPIEPVSRETGLLGVCIGVGPVIAGLWGFVFDPFRKRELPSKYNTGSSDVKEGHYLVATTDSLPEDGTPQRFEVISDKYDAWNFIPRQPIGSVYLRKLPGAMEIELEDGSKKVLTTCEIE